LANWFPNLHWQWRVLDHLRRYRFPFTILGSQHIFTFDVSQVPLYLVFAVVGALILAGIVLVTEAERPIPVTYAKRVRGTKMYGGGSTYLPLRVNQAGVIPIIFALSILLFRK